MSFLGSFKTFFDKVGSVLKKLFGSASFEQTVQSVITYAAPLLETIVGLAAGSPAATAVAAVVSTVQSDLATVSVAYSAQAAWASVSGVNSPYSMPPM